MPGASVSTQAKLLANACYDYILDDFLLIFDNFEALQGAEEALTFINYLFDYMPVNGKIIIAARTHPLLKQSILDEMNHIGPQDLAFRLAEIKMVLTARFPTKTIPPQTAQILLEKTAGWGVAIGAYCTIEGEVSLSDTAMHHFFKPVFEALSPDLRAFLLRTASYPMVNAPFCEMILGDERDWSEVITGVIDNNLFVHTQRVNGVTWVQYYPLFSQFLETQKLIAPDDTANPPLSDAWPQVIAAYQAQNNWLALFEIYCGQADWQATADLLEQVGLTMFRRGEQQLLLAWINALPGSVFESRNKLMALKGILETNSGNPKGGAGLLSQAITNFEQADDLAWLSCALVWRGSAYRLLDNLTQSLEDANRVLALTTNHEALQSIYAEGCRIKGFVSYYTAQSTAALDWFKQAFDRYQELGERYWVALAAQTVALVYTNTGLYERAEYYLKIGDAYWSAENNEYRLANLRSDLGNVYTLKGEYALALRYLEDAVKLAKKTNNLHAEATILINIGELYTTLNEYEGAATAYDAARNIALQSNDTFLLIYIACQLLFLACYTGDEKKIEQMYHNLKHIGINSNYERGLSQSALACATLIKRNPIEAGNLATEAIALLKSSGQLVDMVKADLIRAWGAAEEGTEATFDEDQISPPLVAFAHKYPQFVAQLAAPRLSAAVTAFDQAVPAIKKRLRREATIIPLAAPHLTICAFGIARVYLAGAVVAWTTEAEKVLFFQLYYHLAGLTVEQIMEMLWPGLSPRKSRKQATNLVSTLRKNVGHEVILSGNNRYWFNRAYDYTCDIETFERRLAEARETPYPQPRIVRLQAALTLPNNTARVFGGLETEWAALEGSRLEQLVVTALQLLIDLYLHHPNKEGYRQGLAYGWRWLTIDPTAEEAHRLMMRLHHKLGEKAAIVRQFKRCETMLHQEDVSLSPSQETIDLFKTLMARKG